MGRRTLVKVKTKEIGEEISALGRSSGGRKIFPAHRLTLVPLDRIFLSRST
jgi:hypothetical protein